jgi:hypothetical protein
LGRWFCWVTIQEKADPRDTDERLELRHGSL